MSENDTLNCTFVSTVFCTLIKLTIIISMSLGQVGCCIVTFLLVGMRLTAMEKNRRLNLKWAGSSLRLITVEKH